MDTKTLQQGIIALKQGNKKYARELLTQVVQSDPTSVQGWLWLSGAVDAKEIQRYCIGQIIAIQPDNLQARRGLEKLGPGLLQSPFSQKATTKPVITGNQSMSTKATFSTNPTKPIKPIEKTNPRKKSNIFWWTVLIIVVVGGGLYFFNMPQNRIVGSWEHAPSGDTFHFYANGSVVAGYHILSVPATASGTYRFLNDGRLQMSFPFPVGQLTGNVEIHGNQLIWRGSNFHRISRHP